MQSNKRTDLTPGWCGDLPVRYYHSQGSGPVTVVFIHGFTLTAQSYFQQVDFLHYRYPEVSCLLLDLRGHGDSGEIEPELCTLDATADDVASAIRTAAPTGPLVVVGHSLGGMTALNFLRRYRDLAARVRGVILISTAVESLSSQGVPQVLALPAAEKIHNAVEASLKEAQAFRTEVAALLAPALAATVFYRDGVAYDLVQFHAAMIQNTPLKTMVGFFDDLQHHEELEAIDKLNEVPGVVIVGEEDHFTPPSQSEVIADAWGNSTLYRLADVGHMVILEAPEIVNGALEQMIQRATPQPHTQN